MAIWPSHASAQMVVAIQITAKTTALFFVRG